MSENFVDWLYVYVFEFRFFLLFSILFFNLVQWEHWLRVWLVLEFLGQHDLAGLVSQVQSVPGWVSAINVPHPFQMVIPRLLGVGQPVHARCPDVARIVMVVDGPRRVAVGLPVHRLVVIAQGLDAVCRGVDLVQQQDRSVPPGGRIVCADIIGSFQGSDVWLPESGLLVWRLIHANHR